MLHERLPLPPAPRSERTAEGGIGPHIFRQSGQWTRSQRIRTTAELEVVADVVDPADPPARNEIGLKARRLHDLGMTYREIAGAVNVSEKTVARAVRDIRREHQAAEE